ncbi:ABC transporter permease [Devosia sp. A449]
MPRSSSEAATLRPVVTSLRRLPRRGLELNWRYLGNRLAATVFAIWAAVTIVYFLMMGTGNPALLLAGPQATAEQIAALNALYGFDQPAHIQYLNFLTSSLSGNFPDSLRFGISPFQVLAPAIPQTLLLGVTALLIGACLGFTVGYFSVLGSNRVLRELPLALLSVVQATPVFVVGIVLVLVFAIRLRWLPTGGNTSLLHLVLPALTLGLMVAPPVARLFRASLIQQLEADHIRTAKAKQISMRQVRWRHVALNAVVPVIALLGMQAGGVLGGAVLTETIFGWPGVGTTLVGAVGLQDYPVIILTVMLIATAVCLCNFIADVATSVFDPRTRITP